MFYQIIKGSGMIHFGRRFVALHRPTDVPFSPVTSFVDHTQVVQRFGVAVLCREGHQFEALLEITIHD